ncbi:MAG: hypothetical protein LBP34_07055 [Flavobacteriaceae bacterium]|jgi:hypothetical protein|nr:hypothetical protein [Flavobacteriaceae bacterium]
METNNIKPEDKLEEEYLEHPIFGQLDFFSDFYDRLSFQAMDRLSTGIISYDNLDIYTYSSIKGTIESIKDILKKGRINDAYTLLRKYYDSTILNVYTNLFLEDNCSFENFIVAQIEGWCRGNKEPPRYKIMSDYIRKSTKLKRINELLLKDDKYKEIRNRCNDNTHYNSYKHILLNDNEIYNPNRKECLDVFAEDIEAIFIQHFAYTFYLKEEYMMSSDYIDYIDIRREPIEGSQYWVANFIQETFTQIIKAKRYDIAQEIKAETLMQIE